MRTALLTAVTLTTLLLAACTQAPPLAAPTGPERLVTGLQNAQGSTVGPDGALYVTEPAAGRVVRIDPKTGAVTTFASGLPLPVIGLGGAVDVIFLDGTAYVLMGLVASDVGGTHKVGLYRMDSPTTFTVVADLGAFTLANPPDTEFFVPTGVPYALELLGGAFLVSDGHHNRVYRVTREGQVSVFRVFGNTVPTGMDVMGNTVYMAEPGAIPHEPQVGRAVSFGADSAPSTVVAAGARMLLDVEFGQGGTLFGLSQGVWNGVEVGSPAHPETGSLMRAKEDGTFTAIAFPLDRPTSLEIIGNTAYITTLDGEVWTVGNIANPLSSSVK
ncbi:ScyD/ScyE family protein [Deinococcus sp. QL22]|uniref:ScyD/ScyE family protein n=1 Tax=Deinococcus sp. QL22 TaxID=2939437 RepID=UPI00201708F9|nr:ScyD/ScyE family protein [Deinococcus sp. QL22]UQN06477.1 ScyD/ScyE family protein [Deinococcus sp. QL22]